MSVPVLEAIADAIMHREGWYPDSLSNRNRNPGNLRTGQGMLMVDKRGYAVFESLIHGYFALLTDLRAKVSGENAHGLGPGSSLVDLFKVYAPSADGNQPERYAVFVAYWVSNALQMQMDDNTPFETIYARAGQGMP